MISAAGTSVAAHSGPSMRSVMLGAFRWYNRKLTEKPLLVKSSTSASVMATADYLSQRIKSSQAGVAQTRRDFEWNVRQTIWMAIYGATFVAPFCHHWYKVITFFIPSPFFFTQQYHKNGDSKAKLFLFCSLFLFSSFISFFLSSLFLSLSRTCGEISPFVVSRAGADLLLLVPSYYSLSQQICYRCPFDLHAHFLSVTPNSLHFFIWHTGPVLLQRFLSFLDSLSFLFLQFPSVPLLYLMGTSLSQLYWQALHSSARKISTLLYISSQLK